jgi:hypothetical protein
VRIVTLEDHFATAMFQERFPQGHVPGHLLADRGRYLGSDISAELLNLGDSRLAAMNVAGIDLQVVSLTMPGCEAFDGETAIAMATDANDRRAQGLLRWLCRSRDPGMGLRDGYLHAFSKVSFLGAVRYLSQSQDDPGPSRRRLAFLDPPPERPHAIRRQTAWFKTGARAIPERESRGHDER